MAILLDKTLQGTLYHLYIVSAVQLTPTDPEGIKVKQNIYQSIGHYIDNFVPIILKETTILDTNAVIAIKALLSANYNSAVSAVEQFLISTVPYYQGGVVDGSLR